MDCRARGTRSILARITQRSHVTLEGTMLAKFGIFKQSRYKIGQLSTPTNTQIWAQQISLFPAKSRLPNYSTFASSGRGWRWRLLSRRSRCRCGHICCVRRITSNSLLAIILLLLLLLLLGSPCFEFGRVDVVPVLCPVCTLSESQHKRKMC